MTEAQRLRRIRLWLALFVCGLVIAGATAFPLEDETRLATDWLRGGGAGFARQFPALAAWLEFAHRGFAASYARYPFLAYGTDWLAFGHLSIAVAFAGPIRDPVRNKWVVQFGMIACAMVVPLALICGPLRGIPAFWTPVDMSFGVFGIIPLLFAHRHIRALERPPASTGGGRLGSPPAGMIDRMTVVKINAITVPADGGDELARRFAGRAGAVDDQDGFEGFELLRPTDGRATWLVVTRWRDEESFQTWRNSPAFGHGHRSREGGAASEPPVAASSELWSYEIAGGSGG